MDKRQRLVMEAFARVCTFTDEHPATGALTYAGAREVLDDVVRRLRLLGGAQLNGRSLSRAEQRRQENQMQVLLDEHIRPIAMIAKAQIAPDADVGLPAALRLPRIPMRATALLEFCDHMIEAARPHETMFVANGLQPDFISRFEAARGALERAMGGRVSQVGASVAAGTALKEQLKRGRLAVQRLDAIVRGCYRADPGTLAAWRVAKRVRSLPGGSGASVTASAGEAGAASALPKAA